jgi:PIN domain nuclease of toxin-antitoxin system
VTTELQSPDNELWLSPISVWEALILVERGRVTVAGDPRMWVRQMVEALPRREAPLTHEIAVISREIQLPHQDPADRFPAATAHALGLTLVTADERLLQSGDFATSDIKPENILLHVGRAMGMDSGIALAVSAAGG